MCYTKLSLLVLLGFSGNRWFGFAADGTRGLGRKLRPQARSGRQTIQPHQEAPGQTFVRQSVMKRSECATHRHLI